MIRIATAPVSPSRSYQYDTLGRPTSRTLARQGATRNDVFTYNERSELISDVVDGTGLNGWDYDNIGNRLLQQQGSAYDTYTSNALNQYTAIEDESHDVFTPTYDDDGNQTRIKTSTGIWDVTYNAKNLAAAASSSGVASRPVLFSKEGENLTVACTYDYMGRRATKVVTENGVITTSHRFLYRGYLQIACCDRKRSTHPCLWLITWDPTQPIATRPLAIQKDGTWYTYGWDLTKNIWEAYTTTGYIGTAYTYTAYGKVTAGGSITQPIQWSSEHNDMELGMVYYNYRHYNPVDGRWIGRDPVIAIILGNLCLYSLSPIQYNDSLGMMSLPACNQLVSKITEKTGRYDRNIRKLMDDLNEKGCGIPKISCTCEQEVVIIDDKEYVTVGGYQYDDHSITLHAKDYNNAQDLMETLQHELVHAWQGCNRDREKDSHDTCARVIQEELAAYRESGKCQRQVRMGIVSSVTKCMIEGAVASTVPDYCRDAVEAKMEALRWLSSVDETIYPNLP